MKTIKYKLKELIDRENIDKLLDLFHETNGFVSEIKDLKDNLLAHSAWRTICNNFHRIHSNSSENCSLSEAFLEKQMAQGKNYCI